jgi:hypothetical protein
MAFDRQTFDLLAAPFDNVSEREGHQKKTYRYIPVTEIVKRLNSVFGLNWNFEILREEVHYDNEKAESTKNSTTVKTTESPTIEYVEPPEIEENELEELMADPSRMIKSSFMTGKYSTTETIHKTDTFSKQRPKSITTLCRLSVVDADGMKWSKEAWGGQEVKYFGEALGGGVLNITNDKKGATSDALKKCAELMGVALDLDAASEPFQHSEIISLLKQLDAPKLPPDEALQSMNFYDAHKMIKQLKDKLQEAA